MFKSYIAGFLDADGSIALSKKTSKHPWQRSPEVSFYNADKNILETISKKYGGKVKVRTFANENHNISYELRITSGQTLKLLEDVFPYMLHGKKKKRAELILKYYKECTPRNGKYTSELIKKKEWLNEQVQGIQMRGLGAY